MNLLFSFFFLFVLSLLILNYFPHLKLILLKIFFMYFYKIKIPKILILIHLTQIVCPLFIVPIMNKEMKMKEEKIKMIFLPKINLLSLNLKKNMKTKIVFKMILDKKFKINIKLFIYIYNLYMLL